MLARLRVRDLAVVSDVTIELGPGLNVVTGETGAGKSLVMGSLALLAGERASTGLVREGADRARVTAVFEPRDPDALSRRLEGLGLGGLEDGALFVRREIGSDGRSRAFVGDEPVRVSTLRALARHLVNLHGQREGYELLRRARQRQAIDARAGAGAVVERLATILEREQALTEEIAAIEARRADVLRDRELYEHQLREIDDAGLSAGEEETLRTERRLYLASERVQGLLVRAHEELVESDGAATDRVAHASDALVELAELDERLAPARDLLESAAAEIDEVGREVAERLAGLDFSADRRDEVEARLDLIARLTRRHGGSIEEVLAHADGLRRALADEGGDAEETRRFEAERETLREDARAVADRLGSMRRRAAKALARGVTRELPALGMKDARLVVHLACEEDPGSWYVRDGSGVRLGRSGAERAEFLFSANAGQTPAPLANVASGGELARVVLALESELASLVPSDVLVFDEIDTGIGGRTARAVAHRIERLARERQVIAITHLAAVACVGRHHLRVEKQAARGGATVEVRALSPAERVGEIARMLSGAENDEAARRHAEELLTSMGALES